MPRRGFTLIESLLYMVVVGIVAVLVVNLLLSVSRTYLTFRILRNLNQAGAWSVERMVREIRQARNIAPASVLGSHPGRLILDTADPAGQPLTLEFYLAGPTLMIKEGAGPAASSTPPGVTVENLVFRQINTSVAQGIKLEMNVADPRGLVPQTEKFYGTAVLRGSY